MWDKPVTCVNPTIIRLWEVTHRCPVCWQDEQNHNEHAHTPERDKLLGTLARVQDEPHHQQDHDSQDENPEKHSEAHLH